MNKNTIAPMIINAIVVLVTCVVGVVGQWLLFADAKTGWMFLLRWPILWILYFFLANLLVLHGFAWIEKVRRFIKRD
jgi:hypothetical protein